MLAALWLLMSLQCRVFLLALQHNAFMSIQNISTFTCLYIWDSAALGHEEQYDFFFSLIFLTVDYFKQTCLSESAFKALHQTQTKRQYNFSVVILLHSKACPAKSWTSEHSCYLFNALALVLHDSDLMDLSHWPPWFICSAALTLHL